jgi:hypothetical protein
MNYPEKAHDKSGNKKISGKISRQDYQNQINKQK